MSHEQRYEDASVDYSGHGPTEDRREQPAKGRNPRYSRRRGKGPQSFNGIHRRRRRKFSW